MVLSSAVGLKFDRSVVMPDWLRAAAEAWQAIGLLAGLTFVASLIGHSLTRNAFVGAIIAVIIFVAVYIGWDYYPHNMLGNIRFPNQFVQPR
jgi:amino acid permease